MSRPALGPPSLTFNVNRDSLPGGKAAGACSRSPSAADVKNSLALYLYVPLYASMA